MPHVSKRVLDEGIKKRLFDQLFETFRTAGRRNSTSVIITDLLTPTERTMFAKRLATILLLRKEIPQHVIADYLQVSTSTVARIAQDIDRGKYSKIVSLVGNKMERIVETMIKLIFFSMPPRTGRGRWKNLSNLVD